MTPVQPRGRYAPSPTGAIHVGNARTALAAWLSVRSRGGAFIWRLEDLDAPRVVPGMAETQREDLAWLGLDWDEGPDVGGPCAPYAQSERSALYEEALARLAAGGRLFPCRRSRKDLLALASAPHGGAAAGTPAAAPYPAAFRPRRLESGWYEHLCRAAGLRPCAAGGGRRRREAVEARPGPHPPVPARGRRVSHCARRLARVVAGPPRAA